MSQTIKSVAVIGAGQMGRGIAQVVAGSGCEVLLTDVSQMTARAGRDQIVQTLMKLVDKGKMTASLVEALLERIVPVGDLAALSTVDVAIEAVAENEAVKKA